MQLFHISFPLVIQQFFRSHLFPFSRVFNQPGEVKRGFIDRAYRQVIDTLAKDGIESP
jgi:hypothetical protein